MNVIKEIMDDLNAILRRIETEITSHLHQATAGAAVKQAVTALAQHPDANVQPSAIVSPGKEAPADETGASSEPAAPANDVSAKGEETPGAAS